MLPFFLGRLALTVNSYIFKFYGSHQCVDWLYANRPSPLDGVFYVRSEPQKNS